MHVKPLAAAVGTATTLGVVAYGTYIGLVTGRITVDLGVGRRIRPLGPLVVDIDSPPKVVYDAATAPYAERRSRAMQKKVHILGRTDRMVLAAHHTSVGKRLTAVTVETVTFEPPQRIDFRLLRGPVPHVTETFAFQSTPTGTRLTYTGQLGTDLGRLGSLWGDLVARSWIHAVETSLVAIKTESERRTR